MSQLMTHGKIMKFNLFLASRSKLNRIFKDRLLKTSLAKQILGNLPKVFVCFSENHNTLIATSQSQNLRSHSKATISRKFFALYHMIRLELKPFSDNCCRKFALTFNVVPRSMSESFSPSDGKI